MSFQFQYVSRIAKILYMTMVDPISQRKFGIDKLRSETDKIMYIKYRYLEILDAINFTINKAINFFNSDD